MKITVIIHPNSKKGPLMIQTDQAYEVFVRQPAIDNQANLAVVKLLSEQLKMPASKIKLVSGRKFKRKVFEIPIVL